MHRIAITSGIAVRQKYVTCQKQRHIAGTKDGKARGLLLLSEDSKEEDAHFSVKTGVVGRSDRAVLLCFARLVCNFAQRK